MSTLALEPIYIRVRRASSRRKDREEEGKRHVRVPVDDRDDADALSAARTEEGDDAVIGRDSNALHGPVVCCEKVL